MGYKRVWKWIRANDKSMIGQFIQMEKYNMTKVFILRSIQDMKHYIYKGCLTTKALEGQSLNFCIVILFEVFFIKFLNLLVKLNSL